MVIAVLIFGLIIGSFLNMLIYRLPLGISLINPKRSICPHCKIEIQWYQNIPLLSYIFLKGQCKECGTEIPFSYFIMELITPLLFLAVFFKFGITVEFFLVCFIIASLIVLSFIDLEYKAVPDYLLVVVLVGSFFLEGFSYLYCFIFAGAAVLLEFFVTFYIQNIKAKITKNQSLLEQKALGEGDIPIFALIGGVLGLELGIIAIFLAAFFAIIPSIINKIKNNEIELPFIPFLSLGFIVIYLLDTKVITLLEKVGL